MFFSSFDNEKIFATCTKFSKITTLFLQKNKISPIDLEFKNFECRLLKFFQYSSVRIVCTTNYLLLPKSSVLAVSSYIRKVCLSAYPCGPGVSPASVLASGYSGRATQTDTQTDRQTLDKQVQPGKRTKTLLNIAGATDM